MTRKHVHRRRQRAMVKLLLSTASIIAIVVSGIVTYEIAITRIDTLQSLAFALFIASVVFAIVGVIADKVNERFIDEQEHRYPNPTHSR